MAHVPWAHGNMRYANTERERCVSIALNMIYSSKLGSIVGVLNSVKIKGLIYQVMYYSKFNRVI